MLLDNERLIKTTKFCKPSYVGDPINAVKIFNEKQADELVILDIFASKKNKEPNYNFLEKIASECFMPTTYGGGINNVSQATNIFSIGFEKICINSAFIKNLNFITELVEKFGSQSIVLSIDIKKNFFNKYFLYSYLDVKFKFQWDKFLKKAIDLGIGEIFLNSVDQDGTRSGIDNKLIRMVSKIVDVPIIACGGVGCLEDIASGLKNGASAIGVGSFFIYRGPYKGVLISYLSDKEINSLI